MGSPLGPVLANTIMIESEEKSENLLRMVQLSSMCVLSMTP